MGFWGFGVVPYGPSMTYGSVYMSFTLAEEGTEYSRQVYSTNALLANIGGLFETVWLVFGGLVWVFQYYGQRLDVVFDAFDVLEKQSRPVIQTLGATLSIDVINAYKPFLKTREYDGNTFTIIRSLLPGYCWRNKRRREEDDYYRRGVRDFHHSIDIVHMIRLRKRLKILERAFFNPAQLQLSKMSKYNYLRNNVTSSSDDAEYAIKQERILDGYELSTAIDAALLR